MHVRKHIVTEDVTLTVQLRREELSFEPFDEEMTRRIDSGDQPVLPPDQPLEIVLHREEYEIVKRVVPVERVRITKQLVTEERAIAETLRKEHIEVEHTATPAG